MEREVTVASSFLFNSNYTRHLIIIFSKTEGFGFIEHLRITRGIFLLFTEENVLSQCLYVFSVHAHVQVLFAGEI